MTPSWRLRRRLRRAAIALAVASCFAAPAALANPTGPSVANGQVSIHQQGNLLQITNSPNAIINWQSFSVGANEITRFMQQSASSAVLNRVIGQNPSAILGALQSNGRVFLINPNGIVFGANAQVDVAGLVASTLQLSDADFLGGKLNFTEVAGAGSVVNEGAITTPGWGQVYLVGASVENKGLIKNSQGEVVLAAGNSVELVSPGTPNLRVEVTAPDGEAVNMGSIVADAGRVGIYAGLITQSGTVQANSAQVTANGRIVLKATQSATLEAGSVTTANGSSGGSVTIASGDTTLVAGTVEAKGREGHGGTVQVLGDKVGLIVSANIDVSGETGGGTVLVGGDFQGSNLDIQNAYRTYVGPETTIAADAFTNGDGGKVIVWSDDTTRAYGAISARGGTESGNGGFAEVSSKNALEFAAKVDASAANGAAGTLLLDPTNINVATGGGAAVTDVDAFTDNPGTTQTIDPVALDAAGATVVLQATNDITVSNPVNLTAAGAGFVAQAGNDVNVDATVTTNGGRIHFEADSPHQPGGPDDTGIVRINAAVQSNGGRITLIAGAKENANDLGGFKLNSDVDAGAGGIDVSLSKAAIAPLEFFIGAGGNTQLRSDEVKHLKTTGALVLGQALTAGPVGQSTSTATGSVQLTVDKITNDTSSPIELSSANGGSFQLIAGNGGVFLDRPLTTFQNTVISTTGDVTVNETLGTSNSDLSITAANFILGPSGSINTGTGIFTCNGTGCPVVVTQIIWDGEAGDFDWFNPFNWTLSSGNPNNIIPSITLDTTIGSSAGGTIVVSGAASAKSLIANSPVKLSTGSLSLANSSTFSDSFTLEGGSLAGTGDVAVSGANGSLTWSGGSMNSGGTFFLSSGRSGTLSNALTLNRQFDSSGALTLTDANLGGTGSLNNLGTLIVNNSTLSVPIANSSPVQFNSGTNTVTSGNGIAGGTVDFLGGTTTFLATSTYNVATTNVSGGIANFNNSAISSNLNLSSGTVGGTGNLTVDTEYNQTGGGLATTFTNLALTKNGDFAVGSFTATNSVSLTSTVGAMTDNNGAGVVNVTAPTATLTASGGINLDTAVSTLTTSNTVSGNTAIRNTADVMINGMSNAGGGGILLDNRTKAITLNGTASAAAGTGDAVILVGFSFSAGGAATINPGTGRFLVYSTNPASDNRGPLAYDFKHYGLSYTGAAYGGPGAGDGFIYGVAPTITPSLTGSVTKAYDGMTGAILAAGNYAFSGVIDNDVVTLSNPATGNYADANAGAGKSVTATGLAITTSTSSVGDGSKPVYGYQLSATTASGNVGTINPAVLTYTAFAASRERGDPNPNPVGPPALGTVTGFVPGENMLNATTGALRFDSSATQASPEGQYALNGGGLVANNGNYNFIQASGNATALTVTPPVHFNWTAGTGGAWETGSNWNKGFAPVDGAIVSIADIGAAGSSQTITYSTGATNVKTVTSFEGLSIAGGTFSLGTGAGDVSTFQGGATVALNGGALSVNSGATLSVNNLNMSGGTLSGTGAVTGNVNNVAGTVNPGASPGVLTINGNYTQGAGGRLVAELGGLAAGNQYDQLVVSGNATLDGALDVSVLPGFLPVVGDTFTVIRAGQVNGSFVTTNYPATPSFSTDYQTTKVNLVATSTSSLPPPPSQVLVASTEQGITPPGALQSEEDEDEKKRATKRKPVCKGGSIARGVSGGAAIGASRCSSRGCF